MLRLNAAVTPAESLYAASSTAGSLTRSVPSSSRSCGRSARAERAQELPPRAGREVADRAAEEHDHARPLGRRERVEVALEVAHHAEHADARVALDEHLRALGQHDLGDVERDVAVERLGVAHRVQQQQRLGRHAAAELDQLGHLRRRRRACAAFAVRIARSVRVG